MSATSVFSFDISLSVLNHLGRNLYRSFNTVLGEAISNSWDADAKNVWIYIDKNNFVIKDDGRGMDQARFQGRFLKIGYSKRARGRAKSRDGRPFIGRKGIGKLALLSCADRIAIISKRSGGNYVGGTIDNTGLNRAIKHDLAPDKYQLENWDARLFRKYCKGHRHGTIIHFSGVKDGITGSLDYLRKTLALYFRFSLIDESFNIHLNGHKVGIKDLGDLAGKTEFLWVINKLDDPYVSKMLRGAKRRCLSVKGTVRGFVASVEKPRDLKIISTDERAGVDLFVNGRLRETGVLKHIPTARLTENYLYGQIHFNELDDATDRFTSSREGIVADDPKYKKFLERFAKKILGPILEDWDKWRVDRRKSGDPDNPRIKPRERMARDLYNEVVGDYVPTTKHKKTKLDEWVDDLARDAQFNFGSYADCFLSENLVRMLIKSKNLKLSPQAESKIKQWKVTESGNKKKGNISIEIRRDRNKLSYLAMDDLAYFVDKKQDPTEACLARDARQYKPMRDALMHTSRLSDDAQHNLSSVYRNIKGRVATLLSEIKKP